LRPITEDEARIRLHAQVEPGIVVDANTAVPLGIVVTELITNATKYAFPPPRSGTILLQVERAQSGWIELLIRDNGIGMAPAREGSLGADLIRSLVQQMNGKIDIRSDPGLAVTISFPDTSPTRVAP
jgi:two-component sensor histidine kinase